MAVSDLRNHPYIKIVYEIIDDMRIAPDNYKELGVEYSRKILEISKAEEKKRVESVIRTTINLLYGEDHASRRADTSRLALICGELTDTEISAEERHKVVNLFIQAYKELYHGEIPYTAL